jgi:hypothetical protein
MGASTFSGAHAKVEGFVQMPRSADGTRATLPVVIEASADPDSDSSQATFLVNGTPCITSAGAFFVPRAKTTTIYGPDLRFDVKSGKTGMWIHVSIIIPYIPMSSDGKEPALGVLRHEIQTVIEKAVKRARRLQSKPELAPNVKAVVFAQMERQIVIVSDNRRYRFNWRQVFYRLRPIVRDEVDKNLDWQYFSQTLVTEYEEINGEESKAYRDPRGTFYDPHSGECFPLGTLQVEKYRRSKWTFNKVLFIEKEGFNEALKADGFPQRHDCTLITSKGQPSRAARDLIDMIGESDEPVQVFCLHDCDAAGTIIFQSLQEETRARPGRNIKIKDLGLDPSDARQLAERGVVEIEDIDPDTTRPVADYIDEEDQEWLQSHRVELNAFTMPDFIRWLDEKISHYGSKVVPPADVLTGTLHETLKAGIRASIIEQLLAKAGIDDRVRRELERLAPQVRQLAVELESRVSGKLKKEPHRHWSHIVNELADSVLRPDVTRPQ